MIERNKGVTFLLLLVGVFLLGAHCQMREHFDGGALTTQNGSHYYWDSYLLPLRIHIDSSLSPDIKEIIKKAAKKWEDEVRMDLFEIYEVSPTSKEILGFPVGGVISAAQAQLGVTGWSDATINGEAEIYLFKDELGGSEGRVYGVNMWLDVDLSKSKIFDTVVHEFGHCLTLAHDSDDPSSIMYPSHKGRVNPRIMRDDILRIRLEAFH